MAYLEKGPEVMSTDWERGYRQLRRQLVPYEYPSKGSVAVMEALT